MGVAFAVAIGLLVYLAAVWATEPPSLPVGGTSAVYDASHPSAGGLRPVSFQNVSASGTKMELALVWPNPLPYGVLSMNDYGWQAILIIVSASTAGPFVAHYAIVSAGLATSCEPASGGGSCSDMVYDFSGQPQNATLWYHGVWSYGCSCATPGVAGDLTLTFTLSVTPEVLVGPLETVLPGVDFRYSYDQEFAGPA